MGSVLRLILGQGLALAAIGLALGLAVRRRRHTIAYDHAVSGAAERSLGLSCCHGSISPDFSSMK